MSRSRESSHIATSPHVRSEESDPVKSKWCSTLMIALILVPILTTFLSTYLKERAGNVRHFNSTRQFLSLNNFLPLQFQCEAFAPVLPPLFRANPLRILRWCKLNTHAKKGITSRHPWVVLGLKQVYDYPRSIPRWMNESCGHLKCS